MVANAHNKDAPAFVYEFAVLEPCLFRVMWSKKRNEGKRECKNYDLSAVCLCATLVPDCSGQRH